MPDTQFYSRDNPAIFDAQTQWILDNQVSENIQMVLHFGDIVQSGGTSQSEWDAAEASIDILGNDIPYLITIGNHDYDTQGLSGDRTANTFNTHFGQSRYTSKAWWSGDFFETSKAENSYLLRTISNRDFIFINLELFPRSAAITWADNLLSTYSSRDAIIVTHGYMYSDDTRLDDGPDNWGPSDYGLTDVDGEQLYQDLIRKHGNIIMVLSGHVINDGLGRLTNFGDKNTTTHQILANYQEPIRQPQDTEGGQLRIIKVRPLLGLIEHSTYSPWLDESLTDDQNQFTLNYQESNLMASGETLIQWNALHNEPPASNAATLDTRNSHPVLDFDGSTNESAVFSAVMPQAYDGGGVTAYIHYSMASATSGDIDWDAAFERVGDQQQDIDSDGFAAVQSVDNTTVPATSGLVDIVSIPFTDGAQMDSVAAGEGFRFKVTRDAVSDTDNTDAELRWVELRET